MGANMKSGVSRLTDTVPLTGFALAGMLATLSAVAWVVVAQSSMPMMGMLDPVALGLFTLIWGFGMVAMMFPSLVPMVYAVIVSGRKSFEDSMSPTVLRAAVSIRSALFILGYVSVWTLVGSVFFITISSLGQAGLPLDMSTFDLWAGPVLIATGVYQFTPFKQIALSKCRSPMSFILTRWKNGSLGAASMGADYGLFCTRCCWVLMVGLLTVGAMSLPLMGLFSIIIFVEKIVPFANITSRLVGAAFAALGIVLLL